MFLVKGSCESQQVGKMSWESCLGSYQGCPGEQMLGNGPQAISQRKNTLATQRTWKMRALQRGSLCCLRKTCVSSQSVLCLLLNLISCPPPHPIIYTVATRSYSQIPNSLMYMLFCQLGMLPPPSTPELIPTYPSELGIGIASCRKFFLTLEQSSMTLLFASMARIRVKFSQG